MPPKGSSKSSTTTPEDNTAAGAGSNSPGLGVGDKPRLSENEKKANHIASEQKRRQAIREGFDRLTELVPGLEGQGRSESVVLKKTVDYMKLQLEDREQLRRRVEELERAHGVGGNVEAGANMDGAGKMTTGIGADIGRGGVGTHYGVDFGNSLPGEDRRCPPSGGVGTFGGSSAGGNGSGPVKGDARN